MNSRHIVLSSHPDSRSQAAPIHWGAPTPKERGPIIASLTDSAKRNVIGTHSGAYAVYRALAIASGRLDRGHRPDLTNTSPVDIIGPHAQWSEKNKDGVDKI